MPSTASSSTNAASAASPVAAGPASAADERVLALFEAAGPVPTPGANTAAWVATDPSNGRRPVIIKRLSGGGAGKGRATEALTLHHPNIARTRRWLGEGGSVYVVRDVVRGKNLRQTVAASGAMPDVEHLRAYLLPVFEVLAFAHGRGIAHGGISADNILIADEGGVFVCDWGIADPRANHHLSVYKGEATIAGDVRALAGLISAYLPTRGPFASPVVRGRLEGILGRCETLAALRDTFDSLDKFAASPFGRPAGAATAEELTPIATPAGIPPKLPIATSSAAALASAAPQLADAPLLTTELDERTPVIQPGGGGAATLILKNEGKAPLVIRMIATQHAWLNVRPVELPLTIPAGGRARLSFAISAARLTPGEYRSEVYLSANAAGRAAEDLRGGWFKHTSEVRVTVGMNAPPPSGTSRGGSPSVAGGGAPPFPTDAPRLPPVTGCAGAAVLLLIGGLSAIFFTIAHIQAAIAASLPVK